MKGNGSENIEDYNYHCTNESAYSHNETNHEQIVEFYADWYIILIFVVAALALVGFLGDIVVYFTFGKIAH